MTRAIRFERAFRRGALALCIAGVAATLPAWAADDVVDLGTQVPETQAISEGLFPEDACEQLKSAQMKCMGFKPAVRFALPTASFKLGSAVLPDLLRQQLDRFAEVLRGKKGSGKTIRIEGHADATGSAAGNLTISQRRAEAVRDYLVRQGAEAAMLQPVGLGSKQPKVADPYAAENRRVEIARAEPPKAP